MEVLITRGEGKVTATISGRLDTANASLFEEKIKPVTDSLAATNAEAATNATNAEAATATLWLDCGQLEYISSAGLRQFLSLRKAVAAQGGTMVIANLNSGLKDIFKMTGFSTLFDFA
jgi:anti-sigma B factor antagonist